MFKVFIVLSCALFATAFPAAAQTTEVDTADSIISHSNVMEAKLLRRIPPIMPMQAKQSGYCCMKFDVTEKGRLSNIATDYCSNGVFKRNAVNSLKLWRYTPAKLNGVAQYSKGHTTTVLFVLATLKGETIQSHDGRVLSPDGAIMLDNICPYAPNR